MTERAFVTGAAGQDGRLLAARLAADGVEVHGLVRPERLSDGSTLPASPFAALHEGDARDAERVERLLRELRPTHCYHLAARHGSSEVVSESIQHDHDVFRDNLAMAEAIVFGVARACPHAAVVLAGSCHMFGEPAASPQSERTPFAPQNAYAVAKLAACELGRLARRRGLRVGTAILFQHESPWRARGFLSQRIAHGVADVVQGKGTTVELGDLDAVVDWTWAADAVDALVRMGRSPESRDYVVASGEGRTVRQLATAALARVGLSAEGRLRANPSLVPARGFHGRRAPYVGDATALREALGWRPTLSPEQVMARLVDAALAARGISG